MVPSPPRLLPDIHRGVCFLWFQLLLLLVIWFCEDCGSLLLRLSLDRHGTCCLDALWQQWASRPRQLAGG